MSQSASTAETVAKRLGVSLRALAQVCRRWGITDLSLFGSVLRSDFGPDSDVDLLVTFAPNATLSLFGMAELQEELEQLLGRSVDLVESTALRNPFRRREILGTRWVVYVDDERIWRLAHGDVPPLIEQLRHIVPAAPQD